MEDPWAPSESGSECLDAPPRRRPVGRPRKHVDAEAAVVPAVALHAARFCQLPPCLDGVARWLGGVGEDSHQKQNRNEGTHFEKY